MPQFVFIPTEDEKKEASEIINNIGLMFQGKKVSFTAYTLTKL